MGSKEVTLSNLEQTLTDSEIVLLDFWADWCVPCQRFGPIFEAAASENPDITFGKVDTEEQQELAGVFSISSIPTLMAFRDSILVFAQPGALSAANLATVIGAVKKLDMDEVRAAIANQRDGDKAADDPS